MTAGLGNEKAKVRMTMLDGRIHVAPALVVGATMMMLAWPANAQIAIGTPTKSASMPTRPLDTGPREMTGGKLLATGGVSQLEGAAGGGLTPWAVIGGYGTADQVGANAFITKVYADNYRLTTYGGAVGLFDRVEISAAKQVFDTRSVGAALGLGKGYEFRQTVLGAKVRLFGDAVLDQDTWLPQVSAGIQYKDNERDTLLKAIGANSGNGTDFYLSATKLILDYSLLLNGTVRMTKANEIGILGFGASNDHDYEPMVEGSVGYLINRNLVVGVEYRSKPDNLAIVKESDWFDVFVAWVPTKNVSLTVAYADLGTVAIKDDQKALYLSLQVGF